MPRARPHFLEEREVLKLMDAAAARPRYKERDQALIAVMFYMGLKPSEALRLDVAHIRFDKRLVYVTGTRGKPRTQSLEPDAETLIQRWLDVRNARVHKATAALFTSDEKVKGDVVQARLAGRTLRTDIGGCAKRARLDVNRVVKPHAIRHSFMVRQLKKHMPPEIVEEVLGLAPVGSPSSVIALARELATRDAPTRLLRDAWSEVFGGNRQPSNGYRAAVGAVEAVAIMTVQPGRPKATLGTVIGQLKEDLKGAHAAQRLPAWHLPSTTADDGGLPVLIAMMDLLWKGQHDRHRRADMDFANVTMEEAQMAVALAEVLVRWFRMGLVRRQS